MKPRVTILGLASVLPPTIQTSRELEQIISANSRNIVLPAGTIERLTGVTRRRILASDQQVSDLATQASQQALEASGLSIQDIDALIFAAASSDVTEPATANIVALKLQAHCPAFDIKNACNSFLNGMETAAALITAGMYRHILVVNGEAPSRVVRTAVESQDALRKAFAGYTVGDAGAAMVLGPASDEHGIIGSRFMTDGRHWELSAVLGGGSRFPRDPDKMYFEGETSGLKDVFIELAPPFVKQFLADIGWSLDDPEVIVPHQVSMKSFDIVAKHIGFNRERFSIVLPELGNMVSASIPVALDAALRAGRIHPGTKVLLLGLAAGVSVAPMAIIW